MKKIVIFIVLAASMSGILLAQDTVWQKLAPLSNYYYNNWLGKKDNSQRKLPPSPAHPQVKWPRNSHVSLKMSSTDGHSTQW